MMCALLLSCVHSLKFLACQHVLCSLGHHMFHRDRASDLIQHAAWKEGDTYLGRKKIGGLSWCVVSALELRAVWSVSSSTHNML